MPDDKEIRSDAKLKNLPAEALEDLWRFRNPEEGGTKLPLEEIAVEIPLRYGFTVSLSTLSEFYSWLRQKKRVEAAAERASQARLQLAKDPDMTPEGLRKVGQMIFTSEMIEGGDVKAFVELVKLQLQAQALEINARKLKLLEDSAAEAKAKLLALTSSAQSRGGLTPETLKQIEEAAGLL
jgi:hypothetical protein